MFKIFMKSLSALLCGVAGILLCAILCAPTTVRAAVHDDTPPATPTSGTTNATVNLAMPDGSNAQGRTGTKIQITGSGFQPGSEISLYTVTDPGSCNIANAPNLAPSAFSSQPTLSADGSGAFNISPTWSSNANQAGQQYHICAISTSTNVVAVSSGTFSVLPDPTVNVSTSTANAGDQITVTGANWLPAQQLTVSIAAAQGATAIVSQQTPSGGDGTFSVNLTIPATAPAGSYRVYVVSADQTLQKAADNPLTINAQATATPTVQPSPTPPAATPTPQATPAPTNTGGKTSGPSGMTFLIFGLGGLGFILVIVGLTMYLSYSRR